ncbi:hypothetical protein EW145_g7775 [Phellinidium pouzarii]|uniref:Protein kinase domain-containing protein n=1 Tax=Phellinidium pouzarii TaxID=167371 RepID=A0A4S4KFB3_9AGAM|nr:hypothetical protein EW145_g7775 [Phellinidium pouzarii]
MTRRPTASARNKDIQSRISALSIDLKDQQRVGKMGQSPEEDSVTGDILDYIVIAQKSLTDRVSNDEARQTAKDEISESGDSMSNFFKKRLLFLVPRQLRDAKKLPGTKAAENALAKGADLLTTKSMQREAYGDLCRLVHLKRLKAPTDNSNQRDKHYFVGRYKVTGPALYLVANKALILKEKINDIGATGLELPKLNEAIERPVKLVEDIAANMYDNWVDVKSHKKLLSDMVLPLEDLEEQVNELEKSSPKGVPSAFIMMNIQKIISSFNNINTQLKSLIEAQKARRSVVISHESSVLEGSDLEFQSFLDELNVQDTDLKHDKRVIEILHKNFGLRVINAPDTELDNPNNSGGYGDVYKISIRKAETGSSNNPDPSGIMNGSDNTKATDKLERKVAVKVLKNWTSNVDAYKRVLREARAWSRALRGQGAIVGETKPSTNIVPLLEVWTNFNSSPYPALVSPWSDEGNLFVYIQKNDFPPSERLQLALQVAEGLHYLHSMKPQIIHGDLKSLNVIIFEGRACLADFGIAKILDGTKGATTNAASYTSGFRAPELISTLVRYPTVGSDVYAFGGILLEVLTGTHPYASLLARADREMQLLIAYEDDQTPADHLPEGHKVTAEQKNLMDKCFEFFPEDRPTVQELIKALRKLIPVSISSVKRP